MTFTSRRRVSFNSHVVTGRIDVVVKLVALVTLVETFTVLVALVVFPKYREGFWKNMCKT